MKNLKKIVTVILAVLLIYGFTSKSEELPDLNATQSLMNNNRTDINEEPPSQSAVYIVREEVEGRFAITLVDNENNLVATIGYPEVLPTYCGGGVPDDRVAVQQVNHPKKDDRIHELIKGEMTVKVFQGPLDTEDFSVWCPFFESPPLLAEGNVRVHSTMDEKSSKWKWNVHFQGSLSSPDNEKKKVNAKVKYEWREGDPPGTLIDLVKEVRISLK
ncbi:hypothetical protein E7Z59_05860 [Robertkochia marina]|uniref:Uncharacterized protein n=1 Tax=Robertkochia marina TaxID=1227945 RepID=A0A4S3M634_9FLAO|nr:hypothetical protein [Robertkochia marina]THD69851.1 hypothetical protein E7Z59_05860 [Robertkochia marina]TRZ46804.1 hypothetical protein D3A96_04350 [Robertkochia marina]